MQDHTTKSNTALWSSAKQKYLVRRQSHLCNLQFGPGHRKADHRIAILLELNVIFAIAMIFHHLGLNCNPSASIFFCDFFLRNPFLRRAQSQKLMFFWRCSFLRQNNTLDREVIISANNKDSHGRTCVGRYKSINFVVSGYSNTIFILRVCWQLGSQRAPPEGDHAHVVSCHEAIHGGSRVGFRGQQPHGCKCGRTGSGAQISWGRGQGASPQLIHQSVIVESSYITLAILGHPRKGEINRRSESGYTLVSGGLPTGWRKHKGCITPPSQGLQSGVCAQCMKNISMEYMD